MSASNPHARYGALLVLLIAGAVLRLRAIPVAPLNTSDTSVYLGMAALPVWDSRFLGGPRPFVVPLVYKLLDRDPALIADFQCGIALLSWAILAAAVVDVVRSGWLKLVAFAVVLGLSLSKAVTVWDRVLLSESMALSLLALFVAAWLWLLHKWWWPKAVVVAVIGGLWAFAREPNAYVLCMLGAFLVVAVATGHARVRYLAIAVAFALIGAANDASSVAGQRWVFPFLNVMGQRILPDAERTGYFEARGMPVSPRLLSLAGKWASSEDWALLHDPSLAEFHLWMQRQARAEYAGFLIVHPAALLAEPLRHVAELMGPNVDKYAPPGSSAPLPWPVEALFTCGAKLYVFGLCAALIAGFAGVVARRRGARSTWVAPVALLLLAYPVAVLTWHSDAMEVRRHAVQLTVQLQLGLWLLLLLAIDREVGRGVPVAGEPDTR